MLSFPAIKFHFNKTTVFALLILIFLLLYPDNIEIMGVAIVNEFIRKRVLSLAILFLTLRGIVDSYYSPRLAILFLIMLLFSPTLTFGQLTLATLMGLIILKVLRWKLTSVFLRIKKILLHLNLAAMMAFY